MSNVLNKLQIKIRIKVLGFPLHVCSFQEAIVSFPMCAGVLNLSPTTLFQIILTGVINMFRLFHNTNTFLTQVSFLFFQCISGHILVLSIQHGMCFRILECSRYITVESKIYMQERRYNHECSSLFKCL